MNSINTIKSKNLKKNFFKIPKLLKKKSLIKNKIKGISKNAGRNNSGKITIFHKGGGHKRKYRYINFNRNITSIGIVCNIEYDPNRNSKIAAIYDFNNNFFIYVIAPKNLMIGDIVESGNNIEPKLGNSLPISNIPVGCYIYNVSPNKNKPAQISRSAGTFCKLKEKTLNYAIIELNSGEHRYISPQCFASIGIVSNEFNFLIKKYKAGQNRWLNKRPNVRGVAMNPIDHPHGGGEGKTSGLNKTAWGKFNHRGSTSTSKNKYIIKKYE